MGLAKKHAFQNTGRRRYTLVTHWFRWSSCGAYHSNILGVPTLSYLPFTFMNLINPIFAIVTVSFGSNILNGRRIENQYLSASLSRAPLQRAPKEAHEKALAALAEPRSAGKSEGALNNIR